MRIILTYIFKRFTRAVLEMQPNWVNLCKSLDTLSSYFSMNFDTRHKGKKLDKLSQLTWYDWIK